MDTPEHELDPLVTIRLSDIQHIRDALARLPERHTSNLVRALFGKVAGLHQRLLLQSNKAQAEAVK